MAWVPADSAAAAGPPISIAALVSCRGQSGVNENDHGCPRQGPHSGNCALSKRSVPPGFRRDACGGVRSQGKGRKRPRCSRRLYPIEVSDRVRWRPVALPPEEIRWPDPSRTDSACPHAFDWAMRQCRRRCITSRTRKSSAGAPKLDPSAPSRSRIGQWPRDRYIRSSLSLRRYG